MSLVLTGTSGASNLDSTNGLQFATWTTGTRPASPAVGQMGYNTTTNAFDAYVNGAWVSIASSATAPTSGPLFSVTCSAGTSLVTATFTKLGFNTIVYDTNSNFSTSNNRFTPTVAGYYQFNAAFFLGSNTSTRPIISLYKNGSAIAQYLSVGSSLVGGINYPLTYMTYANGSTDYFEVYGYQDSGSTLSTNSSGAVTYFQGYLARTT